MNYCLSQRYNIIQSVQISQVLRWHPTNHPGQWSGDELCLSWALQGTWNIRSIRLLIKICSGSCSVREDFFPSFCLELFRRAELPGGPAWAVQVYQQILRPGKLISSAWTVDEVTRKKRFNEHIYSVCISDHHCLRRRHHSSEDAARLSSSADRSRGGKQSDRLVIKRSRWDDC